ADEVGPGAAYESARQRAAVDPATGRVVRGSVQNVEGHHPKAGRFGGRVRPGARRGRSKTDGEADHPAERDAAGGGEIALQPTAVTRWCERTSVQEPNPKTSGMMARPPKVCAPERFPRNSASCPR